MATEIRVPTLGESVTEATVGKWFKKVGDTIAADEPLVDHLPGSGKRGQVLKGDVLDAIAKGAPSPPAEVPKAAPSPAPVAARAPSTAGDAAREERVRMTKLRQTIARRLKEAQSTAAML